MKILLADDHALFREGIHLILRKLADDVEILDAEDLNAAVAIAEHERDLDLLLCDLDMPGGGIDAVVRLRERFPELPIIILSASERRLDVERALDAGALGYVPKSSSSQVMLGAIRLVLAGGIYLPPLLLHQVTLESDPAGPHAHRLHAHGLTERQRQVLSLLVQGKSNKLIARALDLTEGTVKIHLAAIFKTLNVNNRTEAVIAAQRLHLSVDPDD